MSSGGREIEHACIACGESLTGGEEFRIGDWNGGGDPFGDRIGGVVQELVFRRCKVCATLTAVDERRTARSVERAYEGMPTAYWEGLVRGSRTLEVLRTHCVLELLPPNAELWDVGCGDGSFLRALGGGFRVRGIEPGQEAVATAAQGGLEVLRGTPSGLKLASVADVVTAFDVLEHMLEPRIELAAMYRMLRPGGLLVVMTGDSSAASARLAGRLWYYLHCAGHVSVFSKAGLRTAIEQAGFLIESVHRVSHPGSVSLYSWLRRILGNFVRRALGRRPAPMHYLWDHVLVTARTKQ